MIKRTIDIVVSAPGLVLLAPLLALIAAAVKATSPGPALFRQERLGWQGRRFRIYKFRSMVRDADRLGGTLTVGGDVRITPFGRFLRRYKLDELPQLLNVLRGEMSLVGPRPEVPEYADMFPRSYERILQVKPGITHSATLFFRNEERLLSRAVDPRALYVERVMPYKMMLYVEEMRRQSMLRDVLTIIDTILRITRTVTMAELDSFADRLPRVVGPARVVANLGPSGVEREYVRERQVDAVVSLAMRRMETVA
ncbi:sugar transferase [bacterium]|nr:sugar transferase [bacterium]MBU1071724.1 sugar transferase [bacterium]MBU1676673.1 sugar transferase [bacterium]